MFKFFKKPKLKVNEIYDPDFVDHINKLFNKSILTDEVVANGYVDPEVILRNLNYQIKYDDQRTKKPDPDVDYKNKIITISDQDKLTPQRFLLAKGFGLIVLHQKHLNDRSK